MKTKTKTGFGPADPGLLPGQLHTCPSCRQIVTRSAKTGGAPWPENDEAWVRLALAGHSPRCDWIRTRGGQRPEADPHAWADLRNALAWQLSAEDIPVGPGKP